MKALRAHVQNGQIVFDEPVELVEGVDVEVLVPDDDEMSPEDMAELEAGVEEGAEQFSRGEFVDARAVVLRLLAKL